MKKTDRRRDVSINSRYSANENEFNQEKSGSPPSKNIVDKQAIELSQEID